jgi:hypothetical protein
MTPALNVAQTAKSGPLCPPPAKASTKPTLKASTVSATRATVAGSVSMISASQRALNTLIGSAASQDLANSWRFSTRRRAT